MKTLLFALVSFCTIFLTSCDKEPLMNTQSYRLNVIEVEGTAIDPIVDGEQVGVLFQSVSEVLEYELELELATGKFATSGSYVMATEIINMPMSAVYKVTYTPNKTGSFTEVPEGYSFTGAFLSLDFGLVDLTDMTAGTPILVVQEDLSLRQSQSFTLSFGDDGWIQYTIESSWTKI